MIENPIQSGLMESEFERTPAGRYGTIDEIANSIAFLASPLSSFMFGTGMTVDGGYSV